MDALKRRLADILMQRSDGVSIVVALAAILLAFGFTIGTVDKFADYEALVRLMTPQQWALFFYLYGTAKIANIVFAPRAFKLTVAISAAGMWGWNYIFLSFTLFDITPLHPSEMLRLLPVLCEVWSLVSLIYAKRER